jgi:hypothetical protein
MVIGANQVISLICGNHKVLTYVEYRAVPDVFQNIDPPSPSPNSELGGGGGWGVNIL